MEFMKVRMNMAAQMFSRSERKNPAGKKIDFLPFFRENGRIFIHPESIIPNPYQKGAVDQIR